MSNLAKDYTKWIEEEMKKTSTEMVVANVGKINPKKHLNNVTTKNYGHFLTPFDNTSLCFTLNLWEDFPF